VEISVKTTGEYWENIFTDAVSDDPDHPLRPFWDEEVVLSLVEEIAGTIQRLIGDKKVKGDAVPEGGMQDTIKTLVPT
jgi:hypothetical protein